MTREHLHSRKTLEQKPVLGFATQHLLEAAGRHARRGQWVEATRTLEAYLDANPEDIDGMQWLAQLYARQGSTLNIARTQLRVATLFAKRGDKGRALLHFERAARIDPFAVRASRVQTWANAMRVHAPGRLSGLASLLSARGAKEQALGLLELALSVGPSTPARLHQLEQLREAVRPRRTTPVPPPVPAWAPRKPVGIARIRLVPPPPQMGTTRRGGSTSSRRTPPPLRVRAKAG